MNESNIIPLQKTYIHSLISSSRKNMADVSVIMGSKSDLRIMEEIKDILEGYDVSYEIKIVSAHRTPEFMFEYAKNASKNGVKVIIAGAGGAAHLPGMVASLCSLPVIGVPIDSKNLNGLDSLYSIAQMPSGVPVATMAINGAKNAGLFALRILAVEDKKILEKLELKKEELKNQIIKQNESF